MFFFLRPVSIEFGAGFAFRNGCPIPLLALLTQTNPRPSPILAPLTHTNPVFGAPNPTLNGFFYTQNRRAAAPNLMETGLKSMLRKLIIKHQQVTTATGHALCSTVHGRQQLDKQRGNSHRVDPISRANVTFTVTFAKI